MKKTVLILLLLGFLFWTFFLPGPRVATDYPYWFPEEMAANFRGPLLWRDFLGADGIGQNVISTAWAWPATLVYSAVGSLGLDFSLLARFLGVLPIVLVGVFGINKLLNSFGLHRWAIFAGSLLFLANTYILLLIDGGHLFVASAYSIFPLAFFYWQQSIQKTTWVNRLKLDVAVLAMSIFDFRAVFLLILLVGLDFIFCLRSLRDGLATALVVFLILVGFHSYWILPVIVTGASATPPGYEAVGQVDSLSFATLGHTLYFLQPHWYKNAFGVITNLQFEFVLIPFLVFLAPVFRKNKKIIFWFMIALLSIFLTKGSQAPFGQIYLWLFKYLPGFSLFRDPSKFFFLIALSYTILVAVTVDEVTKRVEKWPKIKFVFLLFVTCYLLLLVRPVWQGTMTGLFSQPRDLGAYSKLTDFLREDKQFGRVLWLPVRSPLAYSSPTHPQTPAWVLALRRPFIMANVGTYETLNFIREAPFMDQIFDIAGIKYIAYPYPDVRKRGLTPEEIQYYQTFLDQISHLPWTTLLDKNPAFGLLQTKSSQDRFFIAENTWFVVGSDDIYTDLTAIPGFRLVNNALVFVEEQPGFLSRFEEFPGSKILLNRKDRLDVAASFIDPKKFVFPASQLEASPNEFGWWKKDGSDLLVWRDFLQQKYGLDNLDFDYGGGWAVGEGNVTRQQATRGLQITNDKLQNGNILLARVMKSSRGGTLEFYQNDELVGVIDTKRGNPEEVEIKFTVYKGNDRVTKYGRANFSWFDVGRLSGNGGLTIKNTGDINIINTLAVVSDDEWAKAKQKTEALLKEGRIVDFRVLTVPSKESLFAGRAVAKVTYDRISSADYKVKTSGLQAPAVLAFSDSFDSLWRMSNSGETRNAVPLYSLINGFKIEKDGEYEIVFAPQKYVLPGLGMTVATLMLVGLGAVLFYRRR